jgi:hypothetical protein
MSDPGVQPSFVPASRPGEAVGQPATYRPLSLLAVVGAGLGGLYTLGIVLAGLVAFFRGEPCLLTGWLALFSAGLPIAGAVLSVLGLLQIQRSEGTLAGEKAARWGLLLSLLVGLGYWAYLGTTYYAIGREAEQFSNDFLQKLSKNELASAFRLTLPPNERPTEDEKLRERLEARFNVSPEPGRKGFFSTFRQSEPVRMLTTGGGETTLEPLGVEDWMYIGGGYQVNVLYRIHTPAITFDLGVTVLGKEGKRGQGRQWFVDWNKIGMKSEPAPKMTPEGQKLFGMGQAMRERMMVSWFRPMIEGRVEEVYLQTLPAEEREPILRAAANARLGLWLSDGLGSGALPCATPAAVLTRGGMAFRDPAHIGAPVGLDAFRDGGLVHLDKDFWAPPQLAEEIVARVREEFRTPGTALVDILKPDMTARVPSVRREGDHILVDADVMMLVPTSQPRFMVEGQVVLESSASDSAMSGKSWRVRELNLLSGKSIPPLVSQPAGERKPSPMPLGR